MKLSNYRKQDLKKIILIMTVVIIAVISVIMTGVWLGGKTLKPKIEAVIAESKEKKEEKESEGARQEIEKNELENQEEDKKKITDTVSEGDDLREWDIEEGENENISEISANENSNDYILPDSNTRYLDRSDLENLNSEELRLARNEIYARHGRIFADEELRNYFSSKNWYEGTLTQEEFQDNVFNDYETQNLILIKDYEKDRN